MHNFQQLEDQGQVILYNSKLLPKISAEWFQLEFWQAAKNLVGGAPGRGTSQFIQTTAGIAVWRHYQRGGLPGKFIKDSYLWLGLHKTRAWQELTLTCRLLNLGLPVPQPLAASVKRKGCTYTADLITLRLPDALTLNEVLLASSLNPTSTHNLANLLVQVGKTVHKFHAAGLNHVDLNPRNIMVNPTSLEVWLIDFDSCTLTQANKKLALSNIKRLSRGLHKLDPNQVKFWLTSFMAGYSSCTA